MRISFFNDLGDHSKSFWAGLMGKFEKVVNQAKLAIQSHSEPLKWEKIGKIVNWAKLAVLGHSEALLWEKIGKVAN